MSGYRHVLGHVMQQLQDFSIGPLGHFPDMGVAQTAGCIVEHPIKMDGV